MAYNSLNSTDLEVGKPLKTDILTTIRDNEDDLNSRTSGLEVTAAKVIVFNEVVDLASYRTGDVKWSFLSTTQFQAKYGLSWVKIDGSSISGTDLAALYGSTLPDFRNRFPRITDESTRAIGSTEANQNLAHTHVQNVNGVTQYDLAGSGTQLPGIISSTTTWRGTATSTSSSGSSEARPDSGVLSAFVRKEDIATSKIRRWKAPSAFTLTSAICSSIVAGSAGTLDVDIKKGADRSSLSTIFSTRPSVGYAAGDDADSSNAIFADTTVALGDWLQIEIQGMQTGQSDFHFYLVGEAS